jgi:hypothetical protein
VDSEVVETVTRDPDAIQQEIEDTRADLARTIDLIADRISPRRAASRGASKVKSGIEGAFSSPSGNGAEPIYVDGTEMRTVRTLRKDRVAIAVATVAAVVGVAVVLLRRRR